jgi:DNA-binding CsgD family transcriptional regulator
MADMQRAARSAARTRFCPTREPLAFDEHRQSVSASFSVCDGYEGPVGSSTWRAGGTLSNSVAQPVPEAAPCSVPSLVEVTIGEHRCRLVRVDDVVPRHMVQRGGARARLSYLEDEIVHFELGGHRYALVRHPESQATPQPVNGADSGDIHQLLTNRELQIVQLISMGCLSKQVADRLNISEFTVRSYLKTIYCKLGVRSRGAMVYRYAQAFKRGD